MSDEKKQSVANLIVRCLENEGVRYMFGIPGEENIGLVDATSGSKIRFILVRHEQGASFMADMYGRLTGQAAVCTATLGPGAINLLLGVTDAQTDSTPLVAISAQVGLDRIYKESHQSVDLLSMFKPVTKWADIILTPEAVPEMVRKAFSLAQTERPGATYLAVPQDIEGAAFPADLKPLPIAPRSHPEPDRETVKEAARAIAAAKKPVILAGHGIVRSHAAAEFRALVEQLDIPVATTFMAKGVVDDRNDNALGVIGFMAHDYENFAYEEADLILAIGYELQEFDPHRVNPHGDKRIVHINTIAEDTDKSYPIAVNITADVKKAISALSEELKAEKTSFDNKDPEIRRLVQQELQKGAEDNSFPVKPQRMVADIRKALGDDDIVISDTGAIKMWMARLYPTYQPNTCIIANGLSTMAFSLPGAIAAHLACPDRKILAVMGDGGFMMNSQELETAVREEIPLVVLIWEDWAYGLIKWKMDMELRRHDNVDFNNPDFVKYAESFGAAGYRIESTEQLLPTLQGALEKRKGVHVITCPVDYSENDKLTDRLGALTMIL